MNKDRPLFNLENSTFTEKADESSEKVFHECVLYLARI